MLERQIKHREKVESHDCGRSPRMYQRSGDRKVVYFLECAACRVRSNLFGSPLSAARGWNVGGIEAMGAPGTASLATYPIKQSNVTALQQHYRRQA